MHVVYYVGRVVILYIELQLPLMALVELSLLHELGLDLLLLEYNTHVGRFLFGLLKFNGVPGREVHEWNISAAYLLHLHHPGPAWDAHLAHWSHVVWSDVIVVGLILEVRSSRCCVVETSPVARSYHMR